MCIGDSCGTPGCCCYSCPGEGRGDKCPIEGSLERGECGGVCAGGLRAPGRPGNRNIPQASSLLFTMNIPLTEAGITSVGTVTALIYKAQTWRDLLIGVKEVMSRYLFGFI